MSASSRWWRRQVAAVSAEDPQCIQKLAESGNFGIRENELRKITTPLVNLRWYLDVYGQKSSTLYLCNGVALFLGWLAARILLFIFFFTHMYLHFDQVRTIFPLGFYSILSVPPLIGVMNAYWFWKIFKGLVKTLSRKRHAQ